MASRADLGKKPNKNSNLDRTLKDLESAFADWESLSASKPRAATETIPAKKTKSVSPAESAQDVELRKKTKKLLKELRRQLSDLT